MRKLLFRPVARVKTGIQAGAPFALDAIRGTCEIAFGGENRLPARQSNWRERQNEKNLHSMRILARKRIRITRGPGNESRNPKMPKKVMPPIDQSGAFGVKVFQ